MMSEPRSTVKSLLVWHERGNFNLTPVKFDARSPRPAWFSIDGRRQSPPSADFRTVGGIEMDQSGFHAVD